MDAHELMRKSITELLILSCISEDPSFSYDISKRIQERSEGTLHIPSGCIIPHLYYMRERGEIQETTRRINGKTRDCFEITRAGEARLAELTNAYLETHQIFLAFQQNHQAHEEAQSSD